MAVAGFSDTARVQKYTNMTEMFIIIIITIVKSQYLFNMWC